LQWVSEIGYRNAVMITLTLVLSAAYMGRELKRGWVPHDEGTLAQSAERVARGELPHRDFDDVYTGGLALFDAAAFRLLGTNLASLRYVAFVIFLIWVSVVYYIATRFMSVPVASAVTLLAVAWGYPNYAAAMPSWYNLFLATFGTAALFRYIEVEKAKWLLAAGFLGGCSFLAKISGLFFISAAFLFLVFRWQELRSELSTPQNGEGLNRFLVTVCSLGYVAALLALVLREITLVTIGYLFIPAAAIAAYLLRLEFQPNRLRGSPALLLRDVAFFTLGALIPLFIFVSFYGSLGGLGALLRGIFILPQQRFGHHAAMTQSNLKFLGGLILDTILIGSIFLPPSAFARKARLSASIGLAAAMVAAIKFSAVQKGIWSVLWNLLPIAILVGLALLLLERTKVAYRQKLFLLLSVTAGCSIIQFPFFVPSYFCYVAPLAVVTCSTILAMLEGPPRVFLGTTYCLVLCYVLFEVTPGFLNPMGSYYAHDVQTRELKLERAGGLRVLPNSAETYESLGRVILEHARGGEYIYATPDCPEVYFLYGFRNPTRTLFDFFDEPTGRTEHILELVHSKGVNLVVINREPAFSNPISMDLSSELEKEFSQSQAVGRFVVRWKR
jgi:hypothetical protein